MRQLLTDYLGNPFSIYPNPTNESISISVSTDINSVESITILNQLGQVVYQIEGGWNNPIRLARLQKGVYTVQLRFENRLYNEPLIVQ
jgi:hypothetical protein